jgi:aspartate kinase
MDNLKPTVMKFGGTSVQDAEAFRRVAEIVEGEKENSPVVVTSAMSKVTDALLNAFELAKKDESQQAIESLEPHFERHVQVAYQLLGAESQARFFDELEKSKSELREILSRVSRRSLPLQLLKDVVVAYGEQLSSRLLTEVCKAAGLMARHADSRRLIMTDDEHGAANPNYSKRTSFINQPRRNSRHGRIHRGESER